MAQAISSIAQVRALTAPARTYLWELAIPEVPDAAGETPRAMTLRARRASIPGTGVETSLSHFKAHRIKHPGRRNFPHTVEMAFEEGLDAVILEALNNWNQAWLNDEDGSGQGESAVKVDAFLNMLDHSETIITQYKLFGVFPETVPDVSLNYESSDNVIVAVTFSYDRWQLIEQ